MSYEYCFRAAIKGYKILRPVNVSGGMVEPGSGRQKSAVAHKIPFPKLCNKAKLDDLK